MKSIFILFIFITFLNAINIKTPSQFLISQDFQKKDFKQDWTILDEITHKTLFLFKVKNKSIIQFDKSGFIKTEAKVVDSKIEGEIKSFFSNGKLSEIIYYKNNQFYNEQIQFYKNGQIKSSINIKDGKYCGEFNFFDKETGRLLQSTFYIIDNNTSIREGKEVLYYKNGSIRQTGTYKKGMLSGLLIENYENNNTKSITEYSIINKKSYKNKKFSKYYKNGNIHIQGNYFKGKYKGEIIIYFDSNDNSISLKSTFLNDKLNGKSIQFYDTGEKKVEGNYSNDLEEGIHFHYYRSGNVKELVFFKLGKKVFTKKYYKNGNIKFEVNYDGEGEFQGNITEYFLNKKIKSTIYFRHGVPDGKAFIYDREGYILQQILYKEGERVEGFIYDKEGNRAKITKWK